MDTLYDFVVIGGGIVGLSTALALNKRWPDKSVAVLEKESQWAFHQTGNNSGVIHSGIYYEPGSLKARLCKAGCESIVQFCEEHSLPYERCGKLIVATSEEEIPALNAIYEKGLKNGTDVVKLTQAQAQDIEPHVQCVQALQVKSTGIVGYKAICNKFVELLQENGADLFLNTRVKRIVEKQGEHILETSQRIVRGKFIINCAGLFCDRIAKQLGLKPPAKIVPFRGEYYELKPEKRYLVNTLIYPVPNPDFPFLGVHFTKMIDGSVHAGPNAVLSFKREGYKKTDIDLIDLGETLAYPGFWKLAFKYGDEGLKEMWRSLSKARFAHSLQKLIPTVTADDLVPTHAGVRAQALRPDGSLVQDFIILEEATSLHVINAPSPAATSSIEIGKEIVNRIQVA
ncbi:MAG: L-2-hydroxyglutarate oxidase [Phormidesmis sp.]